MFKSVVVMLMLFTISFAFAESGLVIKKGEGVYGIVDKNDIVPNIKVQDGLNLKPEELKHFVEGRKIPIPVDQKVVYAEWTSFTGFKVVRRWTEEVVLRDGLIQKVKVEKSGDENKNNYIFLIYIASLSLFLLGSVIFFKTQKYSLARLIFLFALVSFLPTFLAVFIIGLEVESWWFVLPAVLFYFCGVLIFEMRKEMYRVYNDQHNQIVNKQGFVICFAVSVLAAAFTYILLLLV